MPKMKTALPTVLSLLAATTAYVCTPTAPPVPGPGGVVDTVQKFLDAMDHGNARAIVAMLDVQHGGGGVVFRPDPDAKSGLQMVKDTRSPRFVEVARDGTPFGVRDRKSFIHQVRSRIGAGQAKRRGATKLLSIRADCPSADVSYAIVEFERDGRRMIATALLRHVPKKKKAADPDFRIFQWHASRFDAPSKAPTKKG